MVLQAINGVPPLRRRGLAHRVLVSEESHLIHCLGRRNGVEPLHPYKVLDPVGIIGVRLVAAGMAPRRRSSEQARSHEPESSGCSEVRRRIGQTRAVFGGISSTGNGDSVAFETASPRHSRLWRTAKASQGVDRCNARGFGAERRSHPAGAPKRGLRDDSRRCSSTVVSVRGPTVGLDSREEYAALHNGTVFYTATEDLVVGARHRGRFSTRVDATSTRR